MSKGAFLTGQIVKIDPRTKILMLFLIGYASLNETRTMWQATIFSVALLMYANAGMWRKVIPLASFYAASVAYDIYLSSFIKGTPGLFIGVILTYTRIFMPVFMLMKYMLATTRVSEFVAAFDRMHLPDEIVIPFSVMFRFIPTIKEEWSSIQDAMRFRGLSFNIINIFIRPVRTMEFTLVPLLTNSVLIADDLSAAALTRGLGADTKRSCITPVGMHPVDIVLVIITIFLVVNSMMK